MDIRSIIERPGGTVASLDGKAYKFEPRQPGGPHLCDVRNKAHAQRFLSIPEGYEAYLPEEAFDDEDAMDPDEIAAAAAQDATDRAAAEQAEQAEPEPTEVDGIAGEAAMQSVISDIAGVDRATADLAFAWLKGREPHGKAKDGTVVLAVIEEANEQGYIDGDDFPALYEKAQNRKANG